MICCQISHYLLVKLDKVLTAYFKYTKSHYDINPKAITPIGPIPEIEGGFEEDWRKLRVGGVELARRAMVEES